MSDLVQTPKSVTLAEKKLDALLNKRTQAQRVVLLCDVSGSMSSMADSPGERRIDALRGAVSAIRTRGIPFRQAVFSSDVMWSDVIPEPTGGTNMAGAFRFCAAINPEHVIIVSDGEPDNQEAALAEAKALKCKIDVFYVGPSSDVRCKTFLESLATSTGGKSQAVSFAELESKIVGALGAGNPAAEPEGRTFAL